MSLFTLFSYVQHLRSNNQESGRYEIALWNKLIYPIAVLVMMFVALPFSYLNVREGGISTKIFAGHHARPGLPRADPADRSRRRSSPPGRRCWRR